MSEWGVTSFVSRVAQSVTLAGEGIAAQLVVRNAFEDVAELPLLAVAFPYVEPSPEFTMALREQLMSAPLVDAVDARSSFADRRIVYGVAAFGSLASAAVVVAVLLRSRGINRAAA